MDFHLDLGCYFYASPMNSPEFSPMGAEYCYWTFEEDDTASDDYDSSSSDESQDGYDEDDCHEDEYNEDNY